MGPERLQSKPWGLCLCNEVKGHDSFLQEVLGERTGFPYSRWLAFVMLGFVLYLEQGQLRPRLAIRYVYTFQCGYS